MFSLAYVSSAIHEFTKSELLDLMSKAAANNSQRGLTGMLLHKDGNFMQVLEGEEGTVRAIYSKIADDRRHRGLLILLQGHQPDRMFPAWSMTFRDLNSPEVAGTPGYSEFLNSPLTGKEFFPDSSRCQKLLMTFARSR
ncbi:MAG: hypothetical protein QOE70_636 [Chthoniobacter sp.]|jgi:hypothetical protein|nr:hypothetical protein [Chthoniobacter sp.]